MNATEIVLLLVVVLGSVFGIAITRRIGRQVDAARVRENDDPRQLTTDERIALANHLARQRGSWFWPIVLSGIAAMLICGVILWRLGFIGH